MVEGALGGFVDFFSGGGFVWGGGSVFSGLGVALNMVMLLWGGATKACR